MYVIDVGIADYRIGVTNIFLLHWISTNYHHYPYKEQRNLPTSTLPISAPLAKTTHEGAACLHIFLISVPGGEECYFWLGEGPL